MKNFLLVLFSIIISITTNAQLQRSGSKEQIKTQPKNKGEMKEVALTKVQRGKFKEIKADIKTRKAAVKASTTLTEAEKKSQLKDLTIEQRRRFEAILTEEQKAKLNSSELNNDTKVSKPRRGVTGLPNERTAK